MDVPWEARAQSSASVAGGAALLACAVPATVRGHVAVTAWLKDGEPLAPIAAEAGAYSNRYNRSKNVAGACEVQGAASGLCVCMYVF